MEAKDRIIVALDVNSATRALYLVKLLAPYVGGFKVGLEFTTTMLAQLTSAQSGTEASIIFEEIRELFHLLNGKVFYDGKFDDIPNTVAGASKAVARMGVKMFNVHASAGIDAMMAAVENKGRSLVLAVTVLTSREENDANLSFGGPTKAKVLQFAREAKLAGCDGIVCSPQELELLGKRRELRGLLKVTPGIRSVNSKPDDQNRTMAAAEAIRAGADYLVIGRPITADPDPAMAANKFVAEISGVL